MDHRSADRSQTIRALDFKLEGFSAALCCAELERKVNARDSRGEITHYGRTTFLKKSSRRRGEDLLRTLEVKPPVVQGPRPGGGD